MKELEFDSDQKAKVAYLNETTSETFQYLTITLIMPVLAQLNPNSISPSPSKAELGSAQAPLEYYISFAFRHCDSMLHTT